MRDNGLLGLLAFLAAAACALLVVLSRTDFGAPVSLRGRLLSALPPLAGNSSHNDSANEGPGKLEGNETEAPWPEDYVPEDVTAYAESRSANGIPMVRYSGCRHCSEAAFCNYAQNPGCGGSATGGVVTFSNRRHAPRCGVRPVLSIPRSYVRDIDDLRSKPGTYHTLKQMLHSGYSTYRAHGHKGPVQQCIHYSWAVSVRWVHLHSFCTGARFDGMPGGSSLCATMNSHDDAGKIASRWAR
mmetsp:Transcript_52311/g.97946  ORF Transcript_52311/g.97946 Transcript_52311/m.97946 type:complete len:242 (+) Transcript_52311:61-786(+)